MAAIIGNIVVDDIFSVDAYPREDEKVRCNARLRMIGGNACNTAITCKALGSSPVHLLSAVGDKRRDDLTQWALSYLQTAGVDASLSVSVPALSSPSAISSLPLSVILSTRTSRTIVNHRDIPELSYQGVVTAIQGDQSRSEAGSEGDTPLWRALCASTPRPMGAQGGDSSSMSVSSDVQWAHFEGRNAVEVKQMMADLILGRRLARSRVEKWSPVLSVELERDRDESHPIHELLWCADVAFASKDYACKACKLAPGSFVALSHSDKEAAVVRWANSLPHPGTDRWPLLLVIPLGEHGALAYLCATSRQGVVSVLRTVSTPVHPPSSGAVADTRGAGDTFNAAFISWAVHGGRQGEGEGGRIRRVMDAFREGQWPDHDSALLDDCSAEALRWLEFSCFVAGEKVGIEGLAGLGRASGTSVSKAIGQRLQ